MSRPLLDAAAASTSLDSAYILYVQTLIDSPLWSQDRPSGIRIPWKDAALAAKHSDFSEDFRSAGLYVFGGSLRVPMYVGMTRGSLWNRLRGRYVRGKRSQCQLAADYEVDLISRGIDGFPETVREWYRGCCGGSTARLRGAVAFARNGPEHVWFTLIPIPDARSVRNFERLLIPIANAWNHAEGYPLLLNNQDI